MWCGAEWREGKWGRAFHQRVCLPLDAIPSHALRSDLFCTKKDFKQHLTVNGRRPGVQKTNTFFLKIHYTNTSLPSRLEGPPEALITTCKTIWNKHKAGLSNTGWGWGPQIHITIQGARLMEAAPCDTQFWVLHGRAGGANSSSPGGGGVFTAAHCSPAWTNHAPLLTEGHEASHQQLCSAGGAAGKKEGHTKEAVLCASRMEKGGQKASERTLREELGMPW